MFSVGVNLAEWDAAKAWMDRMVDRASMYTIRQAGREVKATARGVVPVRTGRLQGSITNARQLHSTGDHSYMLTVGPHGTPMYMYSGKIEAQSGYMAAGLGAVEGRVSAIFEQAQSTVLARFG